MACFADRFMVHISNNNTLKSIYNEYFHSITKEVIIFGVILPTVGRFSLQKKELIRIMACAQLRTSCPSLFQQSEILPVPCHYML